MLTNRHVRPKGKGLKYHSQISLLHRNHMSFSGINLVIQPHNTAGWLNKTSYNPQQRRLSAARWTQNGDKLRILNIQVNFLEGLGFVETFCYLLYM